MKKVAHMTQEEIIGCRKWPAWFTVDQMKGQLEWEETPEFQEILRKGR